MIEKVVPHFEIPGAFLGAGRFGSGLINDTYLCKFRDPGEISNYILQRINTKVFKSPELVMKNVEAVASHIIERLRAEGEGDPQKTTPSLIHTKDGRAYHVDGSGGFWRAFHFIEPCTVLDRVTGPEHAFEIGRGLGRFQSLVSDLPPERLHDTLPGFHHTPLYLKVFGDAASSDAGDRVAGAGKEIEFVNEKRRLAPLLIDLMNAGEIPIRVVHNDPKVNNFLMDPGTNKTVCMIDLDTVKPGIVHFDFGDCVRSAANPAGEDAEDAQGAGLDLALFEAIAAGYMGEAKAFLTPMETEMLPVSAKVITFELGMRFLTDHLMGDKYFKVRYLGHNLHRARVQFRLLESIEESEGKITAIFRRLAGTTGGRR